MPRYANRVREISVSKRGSEPLLPSLALDQRGRREDSFTLLADRKRETPVVATAAAAAAGWPEATAGNLYIEEGGTTTPSSKRSQIARIQRNIETILSHKSASQGAD